MSVDLPRSPFLWAAALALWPLSVTAQDAGLNLTMPAPISGVKTRTETAAAYALPIGPYADGRLPSRSFEGTLDQRAWRLQAQGLSLTQLASPLRAQLEAQGFTILLDCETRACGGFDFRFAIDVMPEPSMHVDLGEFRFISALRADEAVSLLVSRSVSSGFVQLTRVGAAALPAPAQVERPDSAVPEPVIPTSDLTQTAPVEEVTPLLTGDVAAQMVAAGSVALDDLVFESGSSTLAAAGYASLQALAEWLAADPSRSLTLVGHTDSSGGQANNIALSKKRAAAVRQALLALPGVASGQVVAEGVGPLAPRATNLTEAGRTKNRRVEAIMTSTQ